MITLARPNAGDPRWRVFYTMPRSEKKCELALQEKDIEVFLPTCTRISQWSDRKKKITLPLFQNYIFARVDERDRIRLHFCKG